MSSNQHADASNTDPNQSYFNDNHVFNHNFDSAMSDVQGDTLDRGWPFPSDGDVNGDQNLYDTTWQDSVQPNNFVTNQDLLNRSGDDANFFAQPTYFRGHEFAPGDFDAGYDGFSHLAQNGLDTGRNEFGSLESGLPFHAENPETIALDALTNARRPTQAPRLVADTHPPPTAYDRYLHLPLPQGLDVGAFSITRDESLSNVVQRSRIHKFVDIGLVAKNIEVTKSNIPKYDPRPSRNDIKRLKASNPALKEKLKKSNKSEHTKANGRITKSTVSSSKGVKSTSASDSSSDSPSSDSEDDEDEKIPLPPTKPTKPADVVEYDTIKSLWLSPNRPLSEDQIKTSLSQFYAVITTIKNRWISDIDAVKKAEATRNVNDVPVLKERVSSQRDMLRVALETALRYGHKDILPK